MTTKHALAATTHTATGQAIHIGLEEITPQVAATMLGTMRTPRQLRRRKVEQFAREMIAGRWQLNGEAIKVADTGQLLDGQHRLNAVIMAERAISLLVVRGLHTDTVTTLDTGSARSYYDSMTVRGLGSNRNTGPVARWWYRYEQGSPTVNYAPTHQELDDVIQRHPTILESAAYVARHNIVRRRCVPSVQGFVHAYGTEQWDGDTADLYIMNLNAGTALQIDDPIYLLRRRLVEGTDSHAEPSTVLALSIKAWNAWVAGEHLSVLRWQTGGARPELFPRFSRDPMGPARTSTRIGQTPQSLAALKRSNEARRAGK